MSFKVQPCANLEEFGQAVFAIGQYFGLEPTEERMERFSKNLPIERMHAARENGTIIGGAGAFPFELTVPGGIVPTAGVTVVGTFPTHRRRGVLRTMMRAQLDDVHARGEPLALLWASEDTIYGRFGYGMASQVAEVSIPKEYSAFARPIEREGTLRIVEAAEALKLFPRVWDRVRRSTPGMLARTRNWWELRVLFEPPGGGGEGGPKRFVVLERNGRPEGYAIYRHKPKWDEGIANSELAGRRGDRAGRAADGRALALPPRHRLGGQDDGEPPTGRPPALVAPCRLRGVCVRASATGSGCGSSTWVRRSRRATYATDGSRRPRRGRRVLPVERRPVAGRAWPGEAHDVRGAASVDVSALGSAYLGAFSFSGLVRGGRVGGAAARCRRARGRDVRGRARTVVPRDLLGARLEIP